MTLLPDDSRAIAEHFNQLRHRSGMSMAKLATFLGYNAPSGIQRYLSPDLYRGGYFDIALVKKIMEAIVGHGNPPITESDVLQLAGPSFAAFKPSDGSSLHVAARGGRLTLSNSWVMPFWMMPDDRWVIASAVCSLTDDETGVTFVVDRSASSIVKPGSYLVFDAKPKCGFREEVIMESDIANGNQSLRTDVIGFLLGTYLPKNSIV